MKKQTGKWDLEQIVRETNNTARAGMDCTPADLFSGRVVRSNTPASARRTIDLAKARKKRMDDQLRIRRRLGRGKLSSEIFVIGDRVRLQNPKSLRWSVTGIVTKTISHQGSDRPSSYEVSADDGGTFLRNGRFLRLREQQPSTENADTDNKEVDTEPDNTEEEWDRSDDSGDPGDSGIEIGRNNKHAEAEYRQSREDSEGQGTVYRRSPRIKKQYRVTYKEDHSSGSRNVSKGCSKGSRRHGPSPDIGGR